MALAISVVFVALAVYTPLSFSALTVVAVCYYMALDKAGVVYGILTIVASILLSLLFGLSVFVVINIVLFVPYSVLAYFIRGLSYSSSSDDSSSNNLASAINIKASLIRVAIVMLFGCVEFILSYFIVVKFFGDAFTGTYIYSYIANSGYIICLIAFSVVVVVVDIAFAFFVKFLSAKIGK